MNKLKEEFMKEFKDIYVSPSIIPISKYELKDGVLNLLWDWFEENRVGFEVMEEMEELNKEGIKLKERIDGCGGYIDPEDMFSIMWNATFQLGSWIELYARIKEQDDSTK